MIESLTPRTDKETWFSEDGPVVDADFARQLERELAKANACAKFPEATLEAIESLKRELAEARRLLSDIRSDAQCAHWHKDIDAAMKAE